MFLLTKIYIFRVGLFKQNAHLFFIFFFPENVVVMCHVIVLQAL